MRARDLVKQILAFSRITAKERKPLQLSNAVEEALKLLRASLPSTVDLRLIMESESGTVLADPTQIQQIVMNLCANAVQAMEDRGLLKLTLSDFSFESPREAPAPDMEPGAYLRLSVSDTGHGMSKEVMEHLFDPFFTTKGPGQGTGLGLSVVHGIVKSHDGAITVESQAGKGSTLTVYLPRLERKTASETDREASAPTGNERILFVDDEELIVEMAEGMLKGLGYRVVPKTNGREALDLFKADPEAFDLIITDQTMPHMTGVELAREMIGIRGAIPIILATGFSQRVDADSARAAGIRAFVIKPLTRSEIAHTIREVLGPGEKKP
jgi:CheY-like chemotaxis protein